MKNKILIIDDDLAVLEILTEWLSDEGFQVIALPKAENIMHMVKSFDPQLVLLDFLLKGPNGGELCLQIKSNLLSKHIPVVIFSAYPGLKLFPERYLCNLFVQKPFDLYFLTQQMNELISSADKARHLVLN
jgi:two-component system response regulator VicR